MNDAVAEIVKQLIRQYGTALVKEPRRVHALLMDCCWQYKREAFVLSTIVQAGMAGVILRDGGKTSPNILRPRLAQQLHDEYGIDQALADWAITAWADALSLTLPDEGQAQVPAPPQKRQRAAKHPAEELVAREAQQAKQRRQAAEQAARREQKSPPFIHGWDSAQVQHLQQTTACTLQCDPVFHDRLRDGSPGPQLVIIPAGRFLMGSPEDEAERRNDERQHEVEIAQPFALGQYPVTFDEYDRFCAAKGRDKPEDEGWGRGRRPVINVSWHDALAYCVWLSQQTGETYRLPTEAEWEYACRAGTTTPFYFGDTLNTDQANYHGHSTYGSGRKDGYRNQTKLVGQFPANAWALYDIHGNVWEWTGSVYDENYGGAEQRCADARESGGLVVRGGSWDFNPNGLRSAYRVRLTPDTRGNDQGFRLSRSLELGIHQTQQTNTRAVALKPPVSPTTDTGLIAGRYQVRGDNGDIIYDTTTGLEWQRCSLGQQWNGHTCTGEANRYTWDAACAAADRVPGWRLPTIDELKTLIYCSSGKPKKFGCRCSGDYQQPTIVTEAFPGTPASRFWSGSPYANSSGSAWSVHFNDGFAGYSYRGYSYRVRLVRGGQ